MSALNSRFCIMIVRRQAFKKAGLTKSISVNPLFCILLSEHDYGDFDE